MRNPNGFGSVYKLSGKRRKPWIARKTIGFDKNGKQQYYTIGYFEKRVEAMEALIEYNGNPIGDKRDLTLKELYVEWSDSKYAKLSIKTVQTYETAWNHLQSLKDMMLKEIRKSHMQEIIDKMNRNNMSKSSCHKVKVLAGLLYKHAMENDIVDKNYAEFIELPKEEKTKKDIFNDLEIKKLESLADSVEWIDTILILIYTGMRLGELLTLTKFNIDLDNMIITGGIKTDAGKDRIIPIHPKIQKYIKKWYKSNGSYLIHKEDGSKVLQNHYRTSLYYPALEKAEVRKLNPHCCRHTFASLLNKAGADTKSIQEIIGHADYSTTANIYTHVNIEELKKAIEKI